MDLPGMDIFQEARGGRGIACIGTRSRSDRNVTDARLEKTSPSTDVPLGSQYMLSPSLRYVIG